MNIIKTALDAYARSKALEKTFLLDRTRTIGASEIGQCARRMYWVKNEGRVNDDHKDGWGARIRGSVMEDKFWVPAMQKRFGKNLLLSGKQQTTIADRYLSATLDGIVINQPRNALAIMGVPDIGPGLCFNLECKTIDPRVNLTEAKQEHMLQTQTGMGLIRDLTKYKPEVTIVSYMDASFWDDVDEYAIRFDPSIYQKMHDRAVKIKTASNAHELKPEGWIAGGKECEHCPFTDACGVIRRSVPERELAADPQFVAEITDLCLTHEKVKKKVGAAEAELNEIKDQIKNRLREKSVRKLPGIVSWSPVKGKTLIDNKSLQEAAAAAGIDIEEFKTTGEPTDMLRVTLAGVPQI